jgi:hypothetical protein
MTRARSCSERNVAVSGKSWTKKNDKRPKPTVTTPSMMKIHAQPGLPPRPSRCAIAAARRPPKDPEKAAAEKKMA